MGDHGPIPEDSVFAVWDGVDVVAVLLFLYHAGLYWRCRTALPGPVVLVCAGAKVFPSPHGAEASPWLQNAERNDDWGEVTPYPTDRDADDIRGLDRGQNPGYAGQSFIGEREWFTDGQLPAGITDPVPPPPMCVECLPPPHPTAGGLVLGGTAVVAGPNRTVTTGGLVIGGSAIAYQQPAVTKGGLVLGGSAIAVPRYRAATAGGLVLGGSAIATTGGIATACCPGVLLPPVFCICSPGISSASATSPMTRRSPGGSGRSPSAGVCPASRRSVSASSG